MCKSPASQQGAVLVISLVLLVTMTVLGIATLTGTRLNEKITSNSQQKSIAFEVAESAIRAVWDVEYLRTRITSDPDNAGDNPIAVVSPEADSGVATGFDQTDGTGKGSDLSGLLTVQYCGEVAPIGSGLNEDQSTTQLASILVDVNSVANIANSSTTSDHLQRLGITTLRTQRTGNCQTR
jgi:type IV pilus assembly protein PilX